MSDSRISKVAELLLRRRPGVFLSDGCVDEDVRKLTNRLEGRYPGILQAGQQELHNALAELEKNDYRARELMKTIAPIAPPPPPKVEESIRILFLNALPSGMCALRVDREHRNIEAALQRSRYRERFALQVAGAVRERDLQWHLLSHKPSIVHFSGHGDRGAIVLEQDDGGPWRVTGVQLAELFGILQGIRCVVLNACATEEQADSISRIVGPVVSWPGEVSDKAATLFAEHFYQALAFGRTLQEAFNLKFLGVLGSKRL